MPTMSSATISAGAAVVSDSSVGSGPGPADIGVAGGKSVFDSTGTDTSATTAGVQLVQAMDASTGTTGIASVNHNVINVGNIIIDPVFSEELLSFLKDFSILAFLPAATLVLVGIAVVISSKKPKSSFPLILTGVVFTLGIIPLIAFLVGNLGVGSVVAGGNARNAQVPSDLSSQIAALLQESNFPELVRGFVEYVSTTSSDIISAVLRIATTAWRTLDATISSFVNAGCASVAGGLISIVGEDSEFAKTSSIIRFLDSEDVFAKGFTVGVGGNNSAGDLAANTHYTPAGASEASNPSAENPEQNSNESIHSTLYAVLGLLASISFSVFFVGNLYFFGGASGNRNSPEIIKKRCVAVIFTCLYAALVVMVFSVRFVGFTDDSDIKKNAGSDNRSNDSNNGGNNLNLLSLPEVFGLQLTTSGIQAIIVNLAFICMLFLGPLYELLVLDVWEMYTQNTCDFPEGQVSQTNDKSSDQNSSDDADEEEKPAVDLLTSFLSVLGLNGEAFKETLRQLRDNILATIFFWIPYFSNLDSDDETWQAIRNYLVGPLCEEFVFRVCTNRLLLGAGYPRWAILWFTPWLFAFAHAHHFWELIKTTTRQQAMGMILFQLFYTWIFGLLANFLLLEFGSFFGVMCAHMLCNFLGFPSFRCVLRFWSLGSEILDEWKRNGSATVRMVLRVLRITKDSDNDDTDGMDGESMSRNSSGTMMRTSSGTMKGLDDESVPWTLLGRTGRESRDGDSNREGREGGGNSQPNAEERRRERAMSQELRRQKEEKELASLRAAHRKSRQHWMALITAPCLAYLIGIGGFVWLTFFRENSGVVRGGREVFRGV